MSSEVNVYCSLEANLNAQEDQDKYAQLISEHLMQLCALCDQPNGILGEKKEQSSSINQASAAEIKESHGAFSSKARYVENFHHKLSELNQLLAKEPGKKSFKKIKGSVAQLVRELNCAKGSGKIDEGVFGDLKSQLGPFAALNATSLKSDNHGSIEIVPVPAVGNMDEVKRNVRGVIGEIGNHMKLEADGINPYKKHLDDLLAQLDAMMRGGNAFQALMFCLYAVVPAANELQEDTVNKYSKQLNVLGELRDDVADLQQTIVDDNVDPEAQPKGHFLDKWAKVEKDITAAHDAHDIDDASYKDMESKLEDLKKEVSGYEAGQDDLDKAIRDMWNNAKSTDKDIGPKAAQAQKSVLNDLNMLNQSVSTVSSAARTNMKFWMDKINQVMGFENNLMHAEFKMMQAPVDNQKVN